MREIPRRPGLRPGRAAEIERALEQPSIKVSAVKSQAQHIDLDDIRFRHAVNRLHGLGERPLYEMLVELAARHLLRTEIEAAVDRFAALDPVMVEAVGGERFAPLPLRPVEIAP